MTWQEQVLANVAKATARTQSNGPGDWVGLLIRVHPDIRKGIRDVCSKRDVSVATYLRRLIVMAIVNETGQPLSEWLPKLPASMGFGNSHITTIRKGEKTQDDGVGMKGMCTHPGCNEVHL